eukprot:797348-Rhodomonas_salina.1
MKPVHNNAFVTVPNLTPDLVMVIKLFNHDGCYNEHFTTRVDRIRMPCSTRNVLILPQNTTCGTATVTG